MLKDEKTRRIIREYLEKGQIDAAFFADNAIDLEEAKDSGLVRQKASDGFEFISYEAFKKYAKEMALEHNYNQCVKAYEKCYEQWPSDTEVLDDYFYYLIKTGNYEEAYNIFSRILEKDIPTYQNDGPLFLLLFSRIIKVPKEDREFLNYINENAVLLEEDDPRFKYVFALNNARKKTFYGNEKVALIIIEAQFKLCKGSVPRSLDVYWYLENKALNLDIDMQKQVSELVNDGRYNEALRMFQEKERRTPLKFRDEVIKHLLETVISISKGTSVTNNDLFVSKQTFDLILKNNFLLAREEERKREYMGKKNPIITRLLDKICEGLTPNDCIEVSLDDLEYYLKHSDYPNFFVSLNKYLKKIGEEKYYTYVSLLATLDVLNNSTQAIDFLLEGVFSLIDVKDIESAFANNFKDRKYANCLVYYYLLKELKYLTSSDIDLSYYEQMLAPKKPGIMNREYSLLWEIERASNVRVARVPVNKEAQKYKGPNGDLLKIVDNIKDKKTFDIFKTESAEEYRYLLNIASQDDNIYVSAIKDEKGYTIFIKYVKDKKVDDSQDFVILGDEAYLQGKYHEALKNYKRAICSQKSFDLDVLKKLILCYLALKDLNQALSYLSICSKIAQIRGYEDIYEPKLTEITTGAVVLTNSYFESLLGYFEEACDFASLYERVAYLVIEDGLSFDEATKRYNLPLASILDLKLYYAEYAFVLGNDDVAMKYINDIANSASLYHKNEALELLKHKDELRGSKEVSDVLIKYLGK